MRRLLTLPEHHRDRPTDALRQRAISAVADVGEASQIPFFSDLLSDPDPLVREYSARGLATCARPGDEEEDAEEPVAKNGLVPAETLKLDDPEEMEAK